MVQIRFKFALLLTVLLCNSSNAFVGINIGTDMFDAPSPSNIVSILKSNQITHVRLFDSNAQMLNALSDTNIKVMISITNEEVLGIGQSPSKAATWVSKNVLAYFPSTNITAICVGNEVLSLIPHAALILVPAMNNLYKALVSANLNYQIKVSSPQSMDIIRKSFPPSIASFNLTLKPIILQLLQFLKNTDSYYMLNAYPYHGYITNNGIFPLDYALFQPLSSVKQIVDPNTLFRYESMFEAMVDATYNSISVFNFSNVPIVVTECGWPWHGDPNEPDATIRNAETFNNNLIRRVLNGSGPPSQPNIPINTYIYELLNEDRKHGPASKRNWGLFFQNGSAIYDLNLSTSERISGNSSNVFCVAKKGAATKELQDGLSWACGPGRANCSAIEPGQPCYYPNNIVNHASYAYNDYYQKMHSVGGTCDFGGTATAATFDPSYGSCIFTGSLNSSSGGLVSPVAASGPSSPLTGKSSRQSIPEIHLILLATIVVVINSLQVE